MKKSILVFTMLLGSLFVFSQSESFDKEDRLKFGFNAGLNWGRLLEGQPFSTSTGVTEGTNGFRFGVLAEYRHSDRLAFSPKAEVSFNRMGIVKLKPDNSIESELNLPASVELMGHVMIGLGKGKTRPYFLVGPNVKIPITSGDDILDTSTDVAIDFGIGLDKAFARFDFAPELRYSYGLMNISKEPSIPDLRYHNVSLVFNFKK